MANLAHIIDRSYNFVRKHKHKLLNVVTIPTLLASFYLGYTPAESKEKNNSTKPTAAFVDSVESYIEGRLQKTAARQVNPDNFFWVSDSLGNDANVGSKDFPFKTINYAIGVAPLNSAIIVENGTYTENIAMPDSVEIYGNSVDSTKIVGLITASNTKGWILQNFRLVSPAVDQNFGLNLTSTADGRSANLTFEDYLANIIVRNGSKYIVQNSFGLGCSLGEDETKITICNKLIYYLFKYCFDMGNGAYKKQVPNILQLIKLIIGDYLFKEYSQSIQKYIKRGKSTKNQLSININQLIYCRFELEFYYKTKRSEPL